MNQEQSITADLSVRSTTSNRLRASIVDIEKLSPENKTRMLSLMLKYYDGVTEEAFLRDLNRKSHVILLRDGPDIQGFSTLMTVKIVRNGKSLYGIFSGDTVIEKEYWGQRALGRAFLKYLFLRKLRRPFSPLYWLLITKGYKTYLLMANNFSEHYPRYEKAAPAAIRAVIDDFYTMLFPEYYDRTAGLIRLPGETCRLRDGAVPLPPADNNPRVAFFERANPGWREGVELACLARMTLLMPLKYALKSLLK